MLSEKRKHHSIKAWKRKTEIGSVDSPELFAARYNREPTFQGSQGHTMLQLARRCELSDGLFWRDDSFITFEICMSGKKKSDCQPAL